MKNNFCATLILAAMITTGVSAQTKPISLHPRNPHYFQYNDKPLVLITSAEHYGALVNLDFDFNRYLAELSSANLNLTRVFSGAYIEPMGAFNIDRNVLAPASNRYISPWPRSSQPGFKGRGNKFDLSKWDDTYFQRLKQFMTEAQRKNVIVEFTLFCPFYEKVQWVLSPMHPDNNINNIPQTGKDSVYTLTHSGPLLAVQEQLVVKLVTELNQFDNLIIEICNEPYFGGVTMDWQHHIASLIERTERTLPNKHLISQNIANDSAVIANPYPAVSVFNFHYATPPTAVKQNYGLNKVIGDNETGFRGTADSTYRKEGWEFILAGGALYNNLDYSFVAGYEDGSFTYHREQPGGGSAALRQQLSYLRKFIDGFDFIAMTPDHDFRVNAKTKPRVHLLSEKGKQYAAYFLHGEQVTLSFPLARGSYDYSWIDPATGNTVSKGTKKHPGGECNLESPVYEFDVALRMTRKR